MPKLKIEIEHCGCDCATCFLNWNIILKYQDKEYTLASEDLSYDPDHKEEQFFKEQAEEFGFELEGDKWDWEDLEVEIDELTAQELIIKHKAEQMCNRTEIGPDYVIPIYREEITTINPDGSITITTKVKTIPISLG